MALTLALLELQSRFALKLHAVYINHQLRTEATQEANLFLDWAQKHNLSAEVACVNVPTKTPSRMAAARAVRYHALWQVAKQIQAHAVAVGHTASDQTETVLMRLLGGAGLKGLSGMTPARPLQASDSKCLLIRPLLTLTRRQVTAFLQARNASPLQDPTNVNPHYLRSRVRHRMLPALYAERPHLDKHIENLTEQLQQDVACLELLAEQTASLVRHSVTENIYSAKAIAALPPALGLRVLRKIAPCSLSFAQNQALLLLCQSSQGSQSVSLSAVWQVQRQYDCVSFVNQTKTSLVQQPDVVEIPGPGVYPTHFGRLHVFLQTDLPQDPLENNQACFRAESISFPLQLRPIRTGDRMQLRGLGRHRKISDILIDNKVPKSKRSSCLVLCHQQDILWLVGHRISSIGAPIQKTVPLLIFKMVLNQ